jgi:hypothetical protein
MAGLEKEQIVKLKDGRTIYKTHNGFKSFVESKTGVAIEVTNEYYINAFKNRIK